MALTEFDKATWDRLLQQLPIGKEGEAIVGRDLTDLGYMVDRTEGKHNYDIEITSKEARIIRVEVKTDLIGHRTGNVGLEFEQNGKPSGIMTTESDMWVWFVKGLNKIYYFDTETVRSFITKELYHDVKEIVNSRFYLLRIEDILDFTKLIRDVK